MQAKKVGILHIILKGGFKRRIPVQIWTPKHFRTDLHEFIKKKERKLIVLKAQYSAETIKCSTKKSRNVYDHSTYDLFFMRSA